MHSLTPQASHVTRLYTCTQYRRPPATLPPPVIDFNVYLYILLVWV